MIPVPQQLRERIRGEFREMPGLCLTPGQLQQLSSIEPALCQEVLDALVGERFLRITPDGAYVRTGVR